MIGQLLVESTQALLVVGQGPVKDLPALPAQGRDPVLAPCRRPVPMKTSMSISPATSRSSRYGDSRWTGRTPHPRLRKTSTGSRWVAPLISSHQRPAAAGDFHPPPDHLRTGARHPRPQQLAPRHLPPETTNKITGVSVGVTLAVQPPRPPMTPGSRALLGRQHAGDPGGP